MRAGTFLALLCAACGGVEHPSTRPNILLILTDDQRFDSLSITGNPYIVTPALDRIANEGTLFDRAYVTTSRCCPARASLLTGKLASAHGVWSNHPTHDFLDAHRTVADHLDEAGYDTAWIGKWHIPNPGAHPVRGFDHWVGYEGPGSHFDQTFNVDGESVESVGFQADRLTDYALEFIERERGDEPFFLVVALKNPHVPMTPAPRHAGRLAATEIARPVSADDPFEKLPAFVRRLQTGGGRHEVDWDVWRRDVRAYWELCLSIDDNVGRLIDGLEAGGQLDETLVVLTADNGQLLGEHGIDQKGLAYEPAIRVPLAMRLPGTVPAGRRVEALALNVDLLPTILAVAGVEPPGDLHGRSLLALLDGADPPWREHFLYLAPTFGTESGMVERAIVERRWKYVLDRAGGQQEEWLYDLQNDPHERENAALDPANGRELERLRALLAEELARLEG